MDEFLDILENMDPMDVLQADLQDLQEPTDQINVLQLMPEIVKISKECDITEKLLPTLINFVPQVYMEVQEVLCIELTKLQDLLLKVEDNHKLLLKLIEVLLKGDRNNNEPALVFAATILPNIAKNILKECFLELFESFFNGEHFLISTAIEIFSMCLPNLDEEQKEAVRSKLEQKLESNSSVILAPLAQKFELYVDLYGSDFETLKIAGGFVKKFCTHIDKVVRQRSIFSLISISKRLTEEQIDEHVSPLFESLADDPSSTVKLQFTNKLPEIQECLGPRLSRIILIPILQNLATDDEYLVRESLAAIILQVVRVFKETCNINMELLWDIINKLNQDEYKGVREQMAQCLINAPEFFSEEECTIFLLPFGLNCFKTYSFCNEILLDIINKLIRKIGHEDLQNDLQPFIFKLLIDRETKWRTKRAILNTVLIMSQICDQKLFNEKFLPFYEKLLMDCFYGVRRIATAILPVLIANYGFDWAFRTIFRRIFNICPESKQKQCLFTLYCIEEVLNSGLYNIVNPFKSYNWTNKPEESLYVVRKMNEYLGKRIPDCEDDNQIYSFPLKPLEENFKTSNAELKFYMEESYQDFIDFPYKTLKLCDLLYFIIKSVLPTLDIVGKSGEVFIVQRSLETWKLLQVFQENVANTYKDSSDGLSEEIRREFDKFVGEMIYDTLSAHVMSEEANSLTVSIGEDLQNLFLDNVCRKTSKSFAVYDSDDNIDV